VDEVKAGNSNCPYVLDPVLGSRDVGDIADHDTFRGIHDILLPRADVVIPNDYELERLAGLAVVTPDAAKKAAGLLIERGVQEVVVTGIGARDAATLDCIVVTRVGAWRVATPRLPVRPVGTGDLLTALYTAARLQARSPVDALSRSVSGTSAIVEDGWARNLYELPLAQYGAALYRPGRYFRAMEFK
jgi:pyridoxine kinase